MARVSGADARGRGCMPRGACAGYAASSRFIPGVSSRPAPGRRCHDRGSKVAIFAANDPRSWAAPLSCARPGRRGRGRGNRGRSACGPGLRGRVCGRVTDHGAGAPGRGLRAGRGSGRPPAWIPAGVSSRPVFMITKGCHSVRVTSLRREQSLRDHDGTGEVGCVLNPEFPV